MDNLASQKCRKHTSCKQVRSKEIRMKIIETGGRKTEKQKRARNEKKVKEEGKKRLRG